MGLFDKPKIYDVGLVACSFKKLPVPAPAKFLYSASPLFSIQFSAAVRMSRRVRILSAKHGLLSPERWTKPYDFALSSMLLSEQSAWGKSVCKSLNKLPKGKLFLLASGSYQEALLPHLSGWDVHCGWEGDIFKTSHKYGSGIRFKPHNWPINWILERVYDSGISANELKDLMQKRSYAEPTVKAQLDRAAKCLLHKVSGGRILSRAHDFVCL